MPKPRIPELEAARASGAHTYFTGRPCKRGHICERYTKSKKCRLCTVEKSAKYRASNIIKHRAASRRWAKANPEKVSVNKRRWLAVNRDRHNANLARWRIENRDRFLNIRRGIDNRRRGGSGKFTADDVDRLKKKQKGRCSHCGKRTKALEVDHILPLALGGSHDPSNLQLLCGPCNRTKGAKDPIAWAQEHGRLL